MNMVQDAVSDEAVAMFLEKIDDHDRQTALDAFQKTLPDDEAERQEISDALIVRLEHADNSRTRSRIISALAAMRAPDAVEIISARLDPTKEKSERVCYEAVIALIELAPDDLDERLSAMLAKKSISCRVRAMTLRLMLQNGHTECGEQLIKLATDDIADNRWAVFRALRGDVTDEPLPSELEREFVALMTRSLLDPGEWRDVRMQAALALGDVHSHWSEAIHALRSALEHDLPDLLRRGCLAALASIRRPEIKDAVLDALADKNSEIRLQATNTLEQVLKPKKAVEFVTDALLHMEEPPPGYIDALRHIGPKAAAEALSANMLHPDPDVARRASDALAQLGGEEAFRTLLAQRQQVLKTYTDLLNDADEKIMGQFESLMQQARAAFWVSMGMHILVFLVGLLLMGVAVILGMRDPDGIAGLVTGTAGFASTLLALFYKNPVYNIRNAVTTLMKVNVVFLGYMRQINQIDATFKQFFLSATGFDLSQMQTTVEQIQLTVENALEKVKTYTV